MRAIPTLLATMVALVAAAVPGQVVQLEGGQTLVGVVEDAHEDGLTLRRLDNGGKLELRWDQLSNESAGAIRTQFGLASDEEGEIMVRAEKIKFELIGGGSNEVVGLVVDSNATTITMRRLGMDYPIPRAQIRRRSTVEVAASEIYTKTGFYDEVLAEYDPGDDADAHIRLADVLTRARDYERAAEHLERALELGGGRQRNLLDGRIQRLRLFQSAASEREALDQIRVAMARKEFDKGVDLLEEFEQRFPDGKLRSEFAGTAKRFVKARERYLTARLIENWYKTAFALARSQANDPDVSFDAARDYAENQMGVDIRARAAKVLRIGADEVEELWSKRLDYRGLAQSQRYTYGVGSWMLGAEAILKNTPQAKANAAAAPSANEKELRRVRERLQLARERMQRASRGGGESRGDDTPEEWWQDATVDERWMWLRAYYAENSGDLVVESAHLNPCTTCAGDGRLTVYAESGKAQKLGCPTCHSTRFRRYIRAR